MIVKLSLHVRRMTVDLPDYTYLYVQIHLSIYTYAYTYMCSPTYVIFRNSKHARVARSSEGTKGARQHETFSY